jgi:hypothetical protein
MFPIIFSKPKSVNEQSKISDFDLQYVARLCSDLTAESPGLIDIFRVFLFTCFQFVRTSTIEVTTPIRIWHQKISVVRRYRSKNFIANSRALFGRLRMNGRWSTICDEPAAATTSQRKHFVRQRATTLVYCIYTEHPPCSCSRFRWRENKNSLCAYLGLQWKGLGRLPDSSSTVEIVFVERAVLDVISFCAACSNGVRFSWQSFVPVATPRPSRNAYTPADYQTISNSSYLINARIFFSSVIAYYEFLVISKLARYMSTIHVEQHGGCCVQNELDS